jgi:hypothetical protein
MRRGLDRPTIETTLREAVIRITGFDPNHVFFSEHAVDTAACPRPCVSMSVMPYETLQKNGTISWIPSLELWYLQVTSAADGTYSATIDGATFSFPAVAQTITQIRNGLLAAIVLGADADYTATAGGAATIVVESNVAGRRLIVSTGTGVSPSLLRGDSLKLVSRATEPRLRIECVGSYANPMTVDLTGVDIAERLALALLDVDETAEMRNANQHITIARVTDERQMVDGKEETIGVIDAILGTSSLHVSTRVGSGRSATATFTERTP